MGGASSIQFYFGFFGFFNFAKSLIVPMYLVYPTGSMLFVRLVALTYRCRIVTPRVSQLHRRIEFYVLWSIFLNVRNFAATFRSVPTYLDHATVACDLTQIMAELYGCRWGCSWYP